MTSSALPFADIQQAAWAVLQHIRALSRPVRHLQIQPLDAAHPASTLWWLTPARGWAMVTHARLYLSRVAGLASAVRPSGLSVGLCLDRGLGRQLAGSQMGDPEVPDLVDPSLTMQPSWFWYRFRNDVLGGLLDAPMHAILARSASPLNVELDLHHAGALPGPGTGATEPADRLAFAILDESLLLHPIKLARGQLAPLNEMATLRDLVMRIEGVQDLSWYWISVRIGVQVESDALGDAAAWTVPDLWHKVLEPWLPWLH